jgi:hypothetical protein
MVKAEAIFEVLEIHSMFSELLASDHVIALSSLTA